MSAYHLSTAVLAARLRRLLLLCVLAVPGAVNASPNLAFEITGLEGELRRNVLAFLGQAPETPQERLNFVVSARGRVENGLMALGYYRPDIDIQTMRAEPVWQMTIGVQPGEPVRIRNVTLQLLGQSADDPEFAELVGDSGLRPGDVLHHGDFEAFRTRLLALGQQRGYLDGEFATSRVEVRAWEGRADITLVYDSGVRYRFGEVRHNESLADDDLIRALQPFDEGDYYLQANLQTFQRQLQQTRFFLSVTVQPLLQERSGGIVPVLVVLTPAKRHNFNVGVGYSTDTEERISATWTTPRINRHGHSQITRLEYSGVNPSGRITYNIPLTHPLNDLLQLWGRTEENEFGDLDSQQDELGIRREQRKGSWVYSYSLRDLNESWEVLSDSRTNDYLLVGTTVSRRTHEGSIVDPSAGLNQLYTLEIANDELGSDVDLVRLTANLRYIVTPFPRHRFVTRAGLGVVEIASGDRVDLAPSLNFFAGGNQSIRGFGYQSIGNEIDVVRDNGKTKTLVVGGDRLAVGSLEYQYYFTENWRGALFVDGGDAFDEGEFDFNYGAGFGVHFITPIGAVRMELAQGLSEENPDWRLHLTVGAEF